MIPLEELAKHSDKYIITNKEETKILASGKTIKTVMKKVEKMNEKDAVLTYIPPINKTLTLKCL
ncbi:MAG: DUF5678 domain-containing protein [Candidatus Levyibacteriota bacterium]